MSDQNSKTKLSYASAGVDIKAGESAVEKIKSLAASTFGPSVLSEIGSFGGFFKPNLSSIASPVLISSADGVGTKLKLAFMTGKHNTVGEDLVNHCINDILVHGAKPLFFLDYIATGKLDTSVVEKIVEGLSRGCRNSGMALLGGETAEMPDFYQAGEYDLAGFIVGIVDEKKIINGSAIKSGDVCIGLPSNGLHTNGYTLARKLVFEIAGLTPDDFVDQLNCTIADALMKVHTCYVKIIHHLMDKFDIHGMAHITGGGIPGNLKRIIPDSLSAEIKTDSWRKLPIFEYLQRLADIDKEEMHSAFNMGIGYILVVSESESVAVIEEIRKNGSEAFIIGSVAEGSLKVKLI